MSSLASALHLKHGVLTEKIIGLFYDVYNELGPGFLESVYEEALLIALQEVGLHTGRQVPIPVWFRGHKIGDFYADLVVENTVVLELKTARNIDPTHEAQLLHYLKATTFELGLILNFGPKPQVRRLLLDNEQKLWRPKKEEKDPW